MRAVAGTGRVDSLHVPPHLEAIGALVVRGRIKDAIAALQGTEHRADPEAGLLLAHLLMYERRPREALVAFDTVMTTSEACRVRAMLGLGDALLACEEPAEALQVFEHASREVPGAEHAIDGRIRALFALGRTDEAESLLADLVRAASAGSAARVTSVR